MSKYFTQDVDLTQLSFLVTGGAGFIGSHICEYLLVNGAKKVRILDDFSTGFEHNISHLKQFKALEVLVGDIRDMSKCLEACSGIDYVYHEAALGSVPRSIEDPILTNEINITGFINILHASNQNKVKRFIYAASSSTYGDSENLPKVEHIIGKPLSPYAVTKYVNELYADVFSRCYGIETVGLRYFNVFGPRQDPNGTYSAVIPIFMKKYLENTPPIINGDGEHTRDFTFVDNVVQANIKAAFCTLPDENRVYNVAAHERTTLNDLIKNIQKISQNKMAPIYGPERFGDIKHSFADISKSKKDLGYNPEVSFENGLQQTYDWFINNKSIIS